MLYQALQIFELQYLRKNRVFRGCHICFFTNFICSCTKSACFNKQPMLCNNAKVFAKKAWVAYAN